ncbi:MAG TPA: hypothetical protein VER55_00945, partial [Ardenticatenaceae bacterium]|nr:hypothetical protein [Ardenticatenaceae bacterium]
MNTLDTSLRCLRHPASIASVGLLVLNDWVFKAAAPSWVTGKLSDFAGLFFFPFVVAAVLAPLLDRRGVAAHEARRLAFGLTALAFALIKTMPWANTLSVEILSHILGGPPQIVRDLTDLIALLALWPAARLWNECANAGPSRVGWVMLVLASVASLATSPPREARVEALAVENGVLYARV